MLLKERKLIFMMLRPAIGDLLKKIGTGKKSSAEMSKKVFGVKSTKYKHK